MNAASPRVCREAVSRLPSRSFVAAVAAVVTLLMAGAAAAPSEGDDKLRLAVEKYLECVEPPKEGESPVTDEVIREHERGLEDAARLNANVVFAKMVVAVRRGEFRSANQLFTTLPRDYQRKLLVLRTKIWSSIHTEDDVDAQREMIFLIHYAEKQGGGEESRQAADFAGRMYGYLSGPLGRPQKELEQEVSRRIAAEFKPAFEDGQTEVSERFAAIQVKLNAAREMAKAKERVQRERDTKNILARIADLEKLLKPMLASLQQAETDLARELKVEEDELHLLGKQMADLEDETALLNKQVRSLEKRIKELRAAARMETDPTKKQLLLSEATRFEIDLRRVELERDKQDTRLVALVNRKRKVQAAIGKQKATLDPQRKAVQELTARLNMLQDQEHELRTAPILGLSPEVVALQTQAQAMETYLPEFWSTVKASILRSFD